MNLLVCESSELLLGTEVCHILHTGLRNAYPVTKGQAVIRPLTSAVFSDVEKLLPSACSISSITFLTGNQTVEGTGLVFLKCKLRIGHIG